jgi:uncharacterized protein
MVSLRMPFPNFREAIREYIRAEASPPEKFSHQARLYALARQLAEREDQPYDDDVLYAAAWLHDLGVFIGHRPAEPAALTHWDHIAYAIGHAPEILRKSGFPVEKIPTVLEVIRTHMPGMTPNCFEGTLLRDADILEQLGAVGILRTVSKTGRDTRFVLFGDALQVLRESLRLPDKLQLGSARALAEPRLVCLRAFLDSAEAEANGIDW